MFDTIQLAKDYVRSKRAEKGYPLFELRAKERGKEKNPEVLQAEMPDGLFLEASQGRQVWVAVVRKCAWCGEPLSMTRQWKKYCNSRCSWGAWNERNPRLPAQKMTHDQMIAHNKRVQWLDNTIKRWAKTPHTP